MIRLFALRWPLLTITAIADLPTAAYVANLKAFLEQETGTVE